MQNFSNTLQDSIFMSPGQAVHATTGLIHKAVDLLHLNDSTDYYIAANPNASTVSTDAEMAASDKIIKEAAVPETQATQAVTAAATPAKKTIIQYITKKVDAVKAAPVVQKSQDFFTTYKTPLLIGGGVIAAYFLFFRKKKSSAGLSDKPKTHKKQLKDYDVNYPEMWGYTEKNIQAEYSGYGNKYRVTSKKPIEIKRGIESNGIVGEIGANGVKNKRVGWYKYYMTESAFKNFCKTNDLTLNALLD